MDFDIAAFKQRTERLCWDDLDLGAFLGNPLDPGALRCIRYMHDVEYHTICYFRDLLVSPAHSEPDVTAFLSIWAFEEYWHGEALAAVLEAHEEPAGARRVTRAALRRFWAPVGSGVMPGPETRHMADYLFGGEDGRAAVRRIDRRVDRLPGLGGLALMETALDRNGSGARSGGGVAAAA